MVDAQTRKRKLFDDSDDDEDEAQTKTYNPEPVIDLGDDDDKPNNETPY